MASGWVDVRLRALLELEATVLQCPDDLAFGLGGHNDIVREICGDEENGAVSCQCYVSHAIMAACMRSGS